MDFNVKPNFKSGVTDEAKARFYRGFDLKPQVDWLSLTKPLIYIKGDSSASVGVMADVTGKAPGLYAGKVSAFRKSPQTINGAPIHEFDLVVTVCVPDRTTPENRGVIEIAGKVEPGFVDRRYIEIPADTTCITSDFRMIEGGNASTLSGVLVDPDGIERGRIGVVSEARSTEANTSLNGSMVVPGVWEVVVSNSMRSRVEASYDLKITLSGCDLGKEKYYARENPHLRGKVQIPLRNTQARQLVGTMTAKLDGFRKREVVEVHDSGEYERTFKLDNTVGLAGWILEFDRETYALFTDCVFRLEEVKSGRVLQNMGLGQRSDQMVYNIPSNLKEGMEYRMRLIPAFSLKKDYKKWSFTLLEVRNLRTPINVEVSAPTKGRINLSPWDWTNVELNLPDTMPKAPAGWYINCVVDIKAGNGLHYRKGYEM